MMGPLSLAPQPSFLLYSHQLISSTPNPATLLYVCPQLLSFLPPSLSLRVASIHWLKFRSAFASSLQLPVSSPSLATCASTAHFDGVLIANTLSLFYDCYKEAIGRDPMLPWEDPPSEAMFSPAHQLKRWPSILPPLPSHPPPSSIRMLHLWVSCYLIAPPTTLFTISPGWTFRAGPVSPCLTITVSNPLLSWLLVTSSTALLSLPISCSFCSPSHLQ